ncbi:hypothetical protein Sjap_013655 [Stephania japonica]|uniref:Uncharacterized protein n=1 Tax=Stephania japonica TaxID=461633 RepID=A0AAP0J043_9MAGN
MILISWLLAWAYVKAGGFGNILSLSVSDFTCHAKSQRAQIIGHVGLPLYMGIFTLIGVAVTSSTEVIFGHVISNPVQLLGEIGGTLSMVIGIPGIALAIVTTNVGCNVVAPTNVLVNLCPAKLNFRRATLLVAVVSIASQSWRILKSSDSFIYTWLLVSALVGPVVAIFAVDYYLLRQTKLDVNALYSKNPLGTYYYSGEYNLIAITALIIGIFPVIPGLLHKIGYWRIVFKQSICELLAYYYTGAYNVDAMAALVIGVLPVIPGCPSMEHKQSTSKFKELESDAGIVNGDHSPIKPQHRTFSGCDLACFWVGVITNVPVYYLAGGLVDWGMSWWHGVMTTIVANTVVSIFLILLGHPGTKYDISFPVFARAAFGMLDQRTSNDFKVCSSATLLKETFALLPARVQQNPLGYDEDSISTCSSDN